MAWKDFSEFKPNANDDILVLLDNGEVFRCKFFIGIYLKPVRSYNYASVTPEDWSYRIDADMQPQKVYLPFGKEFTPVFTRIEERIKKWCLFDCNQEKL